MPYFIVFTKYALKLAKKLDPFVRKELLKHVRKITGDPYLYEKLAATSSRLRSFHMNIRGVEYRIIFEIEETTKKVIVHIIGAREGVHKFLKRFKI